MRRVGENSIICCHDATTLVDHVAGGVDVGEGQLVVVLVVQHVHEVGVKGVNIVQLWELVWRGV